jgi:hypothetical protein
MMNEWNDIQQQQQAICKTLNVTWTPISINSMIAFNESLLSDTKPINGLRHPGTETIAGWYLWSGGDIPQQDDEFFKPVHVVHLLHDRPIVLKYLGLPPGWRFQIDDNGYEDIWFDKAILKT